MGFLLDIVVNFCVCVLVLDLPFFKIEWKTAHSETTIETGGNTTFSVNKKNCFLVSYLVALIAATTNTENTVWELGVETKHIGRRKCAPSAKRNETQKRRAVAYMR